MLRPKSSDDAMSSELRNSSGAETGEEGLRHMSSSPDDMLDDREEDASEFRSSSYPRLFRNADI